MIKLCDTSFGPKYSFCPSEQKEHLHDVDAALSKTDYDAEHQAISVEMVPFHFCETHQNTSVSHSFTISFEFMSVSISFYLLESLHFLRHERGWFEVWPLDLRSAPA